MALFSKSPRHGAAGTQGTSLSSDWTFCEYYVPSQPAGVPSEPIRRSFFGRAKPRKA